MTRRHCGAVCGGRVLAAASVPRAGARLPGPDVREEQSAQCRFGTPIVDGDQAAVPWSSQTRLTDGGTEDLAGVSLLRLSLRFNLWLPGRAGLGVLLSYDRFLCSPMSVSRRYVCCGSGGRRPSRSPVRWGSGPPRRGAWSALRPSWRRPRRPSRKTAFPDAVQPAAPVHRASPHRAGSGAQGWVLKIISARRLEMIFGALDGGRAPPDTERANPGPDPSQGARVA
jgi:hypothetical protein